MKVVGQIVGPARFPHAYGDRFGELTFEASRVKESEIVVRKKNDRFHVPVILTVKSNDDKITIPSHRHAEEEEKIQQTQKGLELGTGKESVA